MSDLRAQIRRGQKQGQKVNKCKSKNAILLKSQKNGKEDGINLAFSSVSIFLHDMYGFGAKRIERFIDNCAKESIRCDNEAVSFVVNDYAFKITNALNEVCMKHKAYSLHDAVYDNNLKISFVTYLSLIFTSLNTRLGFSMNNKSTGKLDAILQYAINQYLKVRCKDREVQWYIDNVYEKIGVQL